jgi:hypothetical protein
LFLPTMHSQIHTQKTSTTLSFTNTVTCLFKQV